MSPEKSQKNTLSFDVVKRECGLFALCLILAFYALIMIIFQPYAFCLILALLLISFYYKSQFSLILQSYSQEISRGYHYVIYFAAMMILLQDCRNFQGLPDVTLHDWTQFLMVQSGLTELIDLPVFFLQVPDLMILILISTVIFMVTVKNLYLWTFRDSTFFLMNVYFHFYVIVDALWYAESFFIKSIATDGFFSLMSFDLHLLMLLWVFYHLELYSIVLQPWVVRKAL